MKMACVLKRDDGKSMKNPDGSVLRFEQLPDWLKDNDFLITGHRAPTNSFLECFKSIFKIHTETVNIWTHLIAFSVSVLTTIYFLSLQPTELHWQEKLVFSVFFAGALGTFGCSSGFHIFCCHSEYVGKVALKFDYSGIVLGTVGSFLPWIYYLFHCSLISQIVYTVVIGLLGTACFYVSMWDTFAEAKFRHIRAGLFIGFGLSGLVPLTHYLINDGLWNAFQSSGIEWIFVMGAFYIIGTVTYALRIPERFWPGRFDILFSSHQIFHVCVCIAVAVDFYGIQQIAKYRLNCGCCTKDFKMAITKFNMDAIINTTLGWNHVRMTC